MPEIPVLAAQPRVAELQLPRATPQQFGAQVFGRLAEVFAQIDEAGIEAESRRRIEETKAKIDDAIKQNNVNEIDPDAYHVNTVESVKEIYKQSIEGIGNPKVRNRVVDGLSPFLIRSKTTIDIDRKEKQVLKAQGDSQIFLEDASRRLSQTNVPAERAVIESEIGRHFELMVRAKALTKEQAVRRAQGILEQDNFFRASRELSVSLDPLKDLQGLQTKYPNLDTGKLVALMGTAEARRKEIEARLEKIQTQQRKTNLMNDTIAILEGTMPRELIPSLARAKGYDDQELGRLYRAFEQGGVNDPMVELRYESQIKANKFGQNYGTIIEDRRLDAGAKRRLLGLMKEQDADGEKHFSKSAEYKQAEKEIRQAVSPRGLMESLTREENERLAVSTRELWDRTKRGENAMIVGRDITSRINREPPAIGTKPALQPRFATPQAAVEAYRRGAITRDQFDQEALLHKQAAEFQQKQIESQQKSTGTGGRGNVRR